MFPIRLERANICSLGSLGNRGVVRAVLRADGNMESTLQLAIDDVSDRDRVLLRLGSLGFGGGWFASRLDGSMLSQRRVMTLVLRMARENRAPVEKSRSKADAVRL